MIYDGHGTWINLWLCDQRYVVNLCSTYTPPMNLWWIEELNKWLLGSMRVVSSVSTPPMYVVILIEPRREVLYGWWCFKSIFHCVFISLFVEINTVFLNDVFRDSITVWWKVRNQNMSKHRRMSNALVWTQLGK